ncbi:MAG: hypothetical protein H6923_07345 [Alphaproteobacteria bacterium]|nr:hypothetical protein [Alphaproteobacteria bacterium]
MHSLEVFNVGNGDSALVTLENGRMMMVDFCDTLACADEDDPRIHLSKRLKEILSANKRDYFDVFAITHLDRDHICGATEFFYLEHAAKYQSKDRIKIKTLWVPAGVLFESDLGDEAKILQAEARYRLKNGKGIRVFSRPDALKQWCADNGVDFEAARNLMTDAGRTAPEFSLANDDMECFIHSPLARRLNENGVSYIVDRNPNCLVFQARFQVSSDITDVLFTGDMTADGWAEIVAATKEHDNDARLAWDLHLIAHHCSYKSIGPDKGTDETTPSSEVSWLFDQANNRGYIVSSSEPIPDKGSEADKDDQPPHREAANYYKRVASNISGKFLVTMQEPTAANPKPLVFEITRSGIRRPTLQTVSTAVASAPVGRAG